MTVLCLSNAFSILLLIVSTLLKCQMTNEYPRRAVELDLASSAIRL